jgi:hypothetical protein
MAPFLPAALQYFVHVILGIYVPVALQSMLDAVVEYELGEFVVFRSELQP